MKLLSIIVSSSKFSYYSFYYDFSILSFYRSLKRFIEEELRPELPQYMKQVQYPDILEDDDFDDDEGKESDGPFLDADELFAIQLQKVSFIIFIYFLIYPIFRPLPYALMAFLVFLKKNLNCLTTLQLLILMNMRVLAPS